MNQHELLAALKPEAARIDAAMTADLATIESPRLLEILRYAVFSGGKRVRPLLTVMAGRLCRATAGGDPGGREADDALGRLAMVFEYLHAASLLHDDVIDHAAERRGRKSANVVWGNATVILAGDFLHTRAMTLAGTIGGADCLEIIGRATATMVEAEFLQMDNVERFNQTEDRYFQVLQGKTAALIAAACEVGALHGGGGMVERAALQGFGTNLGLAFQVVDDLLDYQGDPSKTGKAVGNDFLEGKITLPLIHVFSAADDADRDGLRALFAGDSASRQGRLDEVVALIRKYQGFEYARDVAEGLIREAVGQLESFAAIPAREILTGLAGYVLAREK